MVPWVVRKLVPTVFLVGMGLLVAFLWSNLRADAQTPALTLLSPNNCEAATATQATSHLPSFYSDSTYDATDRAEMVSDCKALVDIRNHFLFGPNGNEVLNRESPAGFVLPMTGWGVADSIRVDNWVGLAFDDGTTASHRLQRMMITNWSDYLSGTIPPAISRLSALEVLHLYGNSLSGEIPAELGDLGMLQTLWLYSNQLSGEIPGALGDLGMLQSLRLSSNELSGEIPGALGDLGMLQTLEIFSNQLSGEIPAELGDLGMLQTLEIGSNGLSGGIPGALGQLSTLQRLDLGDNQLSGEIPAELGDLGMLQTLWLFSNQLSGEIPGALGQLSNLQVLRLEVNRLSGEIPGSLGGLGMLRNLDLSRNELSGGIPGALGGLGMLQRLDLSRNGLSGGIPGALSGLGMLQRLWLFSNELSGEIPAQLNSITTLQQMWLHNNRLSGTVPDLSGLTNLVSLYLCGNSFTLDSSSVAMLRNLVSMNDNGLCTGPAPVVQATSRNREVILSWTFGGADVERFEYRSRVASNFLWVYDLAGTGWTEVPGGASANSVTVSQVTDVPFGVGTATDQFTNGRTYQFQVRAVLSDGGTSFWPLASTTVGVLPPPAPVVRDLADNHARYSACAGVDSGDSRFEDIAGSFARVDIACIYQFGITKGRTSTRFSPLESVSRWQMALFLSRAAGPAGVDLPSPAPDQGFTDISGLSAEAQQAANALARAEIMPGTSPTEFSPNTLVTRVSMARLLEAFLDDAVIGTGGIDPDDVTLGDEVFTDIEDVSRFEFDAIRLIYELDITRGRTDTLFDPDGLVTREQMAAFIVRMLNHTQARLPGVTLQSADVDGSTDLLVSVRDADFQPVADAYVDVFYYTDANARQAFASNGSCNTSRVTLVGGAVVCQLDLADLQTDNVGDFEIESFSVMGAVTLVAWTGDIGDTYDQDTTEDSTLSTVTAKEADRWIVSDNLAPAQRELRYGNTFELIFQIADEDNNPRALANEPIIIDTVVDSGTRTSTMSNTYTSDSLGQIRFSFTQTDPDSTQDGDEATVTVTVSRNNLPIINQTSNSCSANVCSTTWSDEDGVPTTLRLTQAREYTIAGDGASNRVIATLSDQYGDPVRGEELSITATSSTRDIRPRHTDRRGQVVFSYARDSADSLIETITVEHTDPDDGPPIPVGEGGRQTVTHFWVTEVSAAEVSAGVTRRSVLVADTANNRIVLQNGERGSDDVRLVEYDSNDQLNDRDGGISLTRFERDLSDPDATITVELYSRDADQVSRFIINPAPAA